MGANTPRPEPLADLAPHDHWYFTCTSVAKLAEMSDLLDAWGGSAVRLVQVQDRDYRLRQPYEQQLGVSIEAARKVPARLVRALALTGSDLFFTEGADISLIRDAVSLRLFGFVPVVPDGNPFVYDERMRRVHSFRHGSWAHPTKHDGPDRSSPLGKLVRSIQQVTANLRFREDGIHTAVTFSRK
jgi:hypothetical protein